TNTSIATVDSMGRVTARGVGSALIVATAICCNEADTTGVDVTQEITSVDVSPSTLNLEVGGTGSLSATARDANDNVVQGAAVTWWSSKAGVATVSNGQVPAVSAGTAYIRAVTNGVRDSSAVNVTQTAPPPSTNLENE